MYFPYLTGRQEEMLAIRELSTHIHNNDLLVPIIRPYTMRYFERRCIDILANWRISIIVNSNRGNPQPTINEIYNMMNNNLNQHVGASLFPAIEIRPDTTIADIHTFCTSYHNCRVFIIHRNHIYTHNQLIQSFNRMAIQPVHIFLDGGTPIHLHNNLIHNSIGTVILRDGFQRQTPNRNYPLQQNYDDILFTYQGTIYDGFGDFTVVGDEETFGGGIANHVALHITEKTNTPSLLTNHFVSGNPLQLPDQAAKYFDSLNNMLAHTGNPPNNQFNTYGVRNYVNSYTNAHYPGLGQPKRWSIKHHIELIYNELIQMNIQPFF